MASVLQSRLVVRPTSLDPRVTEKFLKSTLVDEVSASIGGNATREAKEITVKWLAMFHLRGNGFASSVADRIEVSTITSLETVGSSAYKVKVTEVSINPKKDEPRKLEGYVVCELSVTEGKVMHVEGSSDLLLELTVSLIQTWSTRMVACTELVLPSSSMSTSYTISISLYGLLATLSRCSTLPLSALDLAQGGRGDAGVSQSIDTVYHAPAPL